MTEESSTITIGTKLYDELVRDQQILDALRAAGVDNWDGWDEAMEMLGESNE